MATRRRLGGKILTKKQVEWAGIPELNAKVNRLIAATGYGNREVAEEFKHGLMAGGLTIRDEARDIVHRRSGRLASAIFAAYGDPKKADILVGVNTQMAVDPDNPGAGNYAGIEEFGNDERPPHPYMRPAVLATRPTVATIVAEKLRFAIEKLASK